MTRAERCRLECGAPATYPAVIAIEMALIEEAKAAREAERESCAKYVESLFEQIDGPGWLVQDQRIAFAKHIAAAIRARGKAG